jgi:16S rRNA (cytosine967-C5)-methyltransferase
MAVMALEELPGGEIAASGAGEAAARLAVAVGDVAARVGAIHDPLRRLGVSASMPDWLVSELVEAYGLDEADALLHAMNGRAPFALRANTLKTTPEELIGLLAGEEVEARPGSMALSAVRLERHVNVRALRAYRAGLFEPQDEGSQLICELVDPPRGGSLIDLCAGAGGKTLSLAAMMEGGGRILACDADWRRLGRMRPRLRRAGVSSVTFHKPGRPIPVSWAGRADRVLVDAPCSGTGALRRNPGSRWRLKPRGIDRLVRTQKGLLDEAADLVRPGGRVIYATCSVLPRENDAVVSAFLEANPAFSLLPASELLGAERADGLGGGEVLRLLPHRHGSDGFYAAVLVWRCV